MIRKHAHALAAAIVCILTFALASCSSNVDLYQYVSGDEALIAQCDLNTIIQNSGSSITDKGIQLSPALQKLMPMLTSAKERQRLDEVLAVRGIDLSNLVIAVNEHMESVITFRVTNQQALRQYLMSLAYDDMKESEEKGYTIYKLNSQCTVFIYNNIGCMYLADRAVDTSDMEAMKQATIDNPLQQWQAQALQSGSTFNMLINLPKYVRLWENIPSMRSFSLKSLQVGYDDAQLDHAFAKINASLSGLQFNAKIALVGNEGSPLVSKYAAQKLDTSLLGYANSDDIFVAMGSVPGSVNWPEVLNQTIQEIGGYRQFGLDRETVNAIGEVLNDINGSVLLAAGPKNPLMIQSPEGWDVVLAAQMKPDMAAKYMSQIKDLVEATNQSFAQLADQYAAIGYHGYKPKKITCTEGADGMKIDIPEAATFYIKSEHDIFLASLAPVTQLSDCPIDQAEFNGMCGGMIFKLPRQNALSSILKLPFGLDITYLSDGEEATFTMKETDTEGLLLENIFKLFAGQAH